MRSDASLMAPVAVPILFQALFSFLTIANSLGRGNINLVAVALKSADMDGRCGEAMNAVQCNGLI